MKIQIASDIHSEFHNHNSDNKFKENPEADIILIAGDTASSEKNSYNYILNNTSGNIPVVIIAGNHEYYHSKSRLGAIPRRIKRIIQKKSHIHWLQQNHIKIGNTRIFGTTLWTDYTYTTSPTPQISRIIASQQLNDFNHIRLDPKTYFGKTRKIKPQDMANLFKKEKEAIIQFLKKYSNDGTDKIIMTHHTPIGVTPPDSNLSSAYQNDLNSELNKLQIQTIEMPKLWAFGHTHTPFHKTIHNIKFVQNPHGYPSHNTPYNNNLIEI